MMGERESLTVVRDRLQKEFDNLIYPVQWGTFILGRVAQLEAELAEAKTQLSYIREHGPDVFITKEEQLKAENEGLKKENEVAYRKIDELDALLCVALADTEESE